MFVVFLRAVCVLAGILWIVSVLWGRWLDRQNQSRPRGHCPEPEAISRDNAATVCGYLYTLTYFLFFVAVPAFLPRGGIWGPDFTGNRLLGLLLLLLLVAALYWGIFGPLYRWATGQFPRRNDTEAESPKTT